MSQDVGMPSTSSNSQIPPSKPTTSHPPYSKPILGPYIHIPIPSSLPSILGPYVPSPSPSSLPSILGPYIHPSTISMSSTSSSHATSKDQQRHTSLNSLPYFPSIPSPSCTHTMANGSKLDAKEKENKDKNPQKHKDQHVPTK